MSPKLAEFTLAQDTHYPADVGSAWIQWKGTKVCMDVYCPCGYISHIDEEFAYFYECVGCGAKYAVGATVKLIPLPEEFWDTIEKGCGFKRDEEAYTSGES